ncbi:MAG: FAD-dependent oxidoreductase [Puniceicoccales bacterium]|jgi:phytoene dehydrogenase-like protein|nr:FAD-dependent oxidoreductase [Puniceicoccales bacterium]
MSAISDKYDSIIIGAGLSGLAAGIRLAQFGKKVLLLEKHYVIGGLNSFYSRLGRRIDVGLHAITNFVKKGITGSPLTKLLRQLRLSHDSLELSEQKSSKILLNQLVVKFNNDFSLLESEISRLFPQAMDRFKKLVEMIKEYNPFTTTSEYISAHGILSQVLNNRELEDILLLPTSYYGSAREDDMDWRQFVIMFRSIFLEGFARPFDGIKKILQLLITKFSELGGEKKLRCAVKKNRNDKWQGQWCSS